MQRNICGHCGKRLAGAEETIWCARCLEWYREDYVACRPTLAASATGVTGGLTSQPGGGRRDTGNHCANVKANPGTEGTAGVCGSLRKFAEVCGSCENQEEV
jgi:hypothetical protein